MTEYKRNTKVLFVDDEPAVLSSFASLMRRENADVHVLQDSTTIWQKLEEDGPFAIVLSDQRMPGLDGIAVLEAVAHKHPTTMRVMVSGFDDHSATRRAINIAGISSYVIKPWNDDDLLALIREGIDRFNLTEEKTQLATTLASSHESLQSLLEHMVENDEQRRKDAADTITALMREKELMLREIHHRVKNNMQVIASLLNQHAAFVTRDNAVDVWKKAVARIHCMAMVHQDLYESKDFGDVKFLEYLKAQVADLIQRSGKYSISALVEGDAAGIAIGIDIAVPLGMLIHELVANALEHAFPGRADGMVRIQMHLREGAVLEVIVEDNGIGMKDALPGADGFGAMLIEALVAQLGASLQRTTLNGTAYRLRIELPRRH
jgi:two-component sensor histidine kinase/FixJ family two-component response regulator